MKSPKGYYAGRKDDSQKLRWTLLPVKEIEAVIKVLEFGAIKYKAWNWQKVDGGRERYLNAAYRHMAAISKGEFEDQETKISHYAHAICSLLFSFWHASKTRKDRANDDGPFYSEEKK